MPTHPADELRDLICARLNIAPAVLICPRERSAMTPCVARDGELATSDDGVCVGCELTVTDLLAVERAKHPAPRAPERADRDTDRD